MANTYVTLDVLKSTGGLNLTSTAYDTRLVYLAENISAQIDRYCNRTFYPWVGTLRFSGDGSTLVISPTDLISLTSLKEDTNEDGTFETTWAGTGIGGTDFLLEPYAAGPTVSHIMRPYTRIQVNPMSNGTQDVFIRQSNNYQLVGTYGYSFITRDGGKTLSGSHGGSATTTLIVNATATGTGLEVGQLIYVDTELMYVRSVTTGTLIGVDRGINGFPVGTHASGTSVLVVQFPGPIQEAALIQTARVWKRTESAFSNLVGLDQTGQVAVFQGGLDGDVRALLQPFRKYAI